MDRSLCVYIYIYMHDLRCLFVYGDIFIIILKAYRSAFSGGIYAPSWIVYHARRSAGGGEEGERG